MNPSGVLCCGNIVYDTLVKPVDELKGRGTTFVDSIHYRGGGNGANTSRALAVLDIPVRLLSVIGADEQGDFALRLIKASGVDITYITRVAAPTAASIVLIDSSGDRRFLHRPGASEQGFAQPIEFTAERCAGISHFHLASFFVLPLLRAHGPEVLIRARRAGLTTSFDTNWDPDNGWMNTLAPCIPYLDVLFMNQDEARMITGHSDPASGASVVLRKGLPVCVMKLGSRGSAIYTCDRELICPAFNVDVKDTTGAGDCFVAGFLAARQRGASFAEAGHFANAVAALSIRKIGAVEGVLSRSETETWMRATPLRNQAHVNVQAR